MLLLVMIMISVDWPKNTAEILHLQNISHALFCRTLQKYNAMQSEL